VIENFCLKQNYKKSVFNTSIIININIFLVDITARHLLQIASITINHIMVTTFRHIVLIKPIRMIIHQAAVIHMQMVDTVRHLIHVVIIITTYQQNEDINLHHHDQNQVLRIINRHTVEKKLKLKLKFHLVLPRPI
jgi:hypothetical protein